MIRHACRLAFGTLVLGLVMFIGALVIADAVMQGIAR
jgi:hypothetical protein